MGACEAISTFGTFFAREVTALAGTSGEWEEDELKACANNFDFQVAFVRISCGFLFAIVYPASLRCIFLRFGINLKRSLACLVCR